MHVRFYFIQIISLYVSYVTSQLCGFHFVLFLKSYIHIKLVFMFDIQVVIQIASKYIDLLLFTVKSCPISAICMCCTTTCVKQ